jgi:hypothetical protein
MDSSARLAIETGADGFSQGRRAAAHGRGHPVRRLLIAIGVAVALLAAAGALIPWWGPRVFPWLVVPPRGFEAAFVPAEPDYAAPASWAALPETPDGADALPPGAEVEAAQAEAPADVFFVHPTTYYDRRRWNAPIDAGLANRITDEGVLPQQASAFNGAGRVFAPRYRQMTLGGFPSGDARSRERALEIAYTDVRRAFDAFLARSGAGRPILLAGHSQGSLHLRRLLPEVMGDAALRERLVAAYLVGARVPANGATQGPVAIEACRAPRDTGCVIAWRTFSDGGDPWLHEAKGPEPDLCTNPLTWTTADAIATRDQNQGSLPLAGLQGLLPLDAHLVGAQCRDGILWTQTPLAPGYRFAVLPGGNYHVYDYNLFWMNVRRNAEARVRAWQERHPGAAASASGGP